MRWARPGPAGCAGATPTQVLALEWPRVCWRCLSPSLSAGAQLAVGLTSGQLVTLCWQLPATWGGASGNEGGVVLPLPERRVCWGQRDGMAVRHIAWQKTSEV